MTSTSVIIVAAGRGRRLGAEIPKQYIALGDRCALRRSIDVFLAMPNVTRIVTVIHPDDRAMFNAATAGLTDDRFCPATNGGETRAESVRNGLDALRAFTPETVLIHDAARPFVPAKVISDVLAALDESDGAFAALPVVDALWRADGAQAQTPVARDGLWRAQTPQGFRFDAICDAHATHDGTGADDVAVARDAGLSVQIVLGSEQNYKITTPADLERALADARLADAGSQAAE